MKRIDGELTAAQTAKMLALREQVAQTYKAWQGCADKAQRDKLGKAWGLAKDRAEAFADKYF